MTASIVYTLCAVTCVICAALLARGYLKSRARLLLWSMMCFIALTVNNLLLVIDRVFLLEEIDLYQMRLVVTVVGMGILVYGLIWDVDR